MRRNFWSKSWSQLLTKGPFIKDVGNFFGRFWYPPSPCRNFDPDLPNFFLLISCNIGIWDAPSPPLKTFRLLWWMALKVMSLSFIYPPISLSLLVFFGSSASWKFDSQMKPLKVMTRAFWASLKIEVLDENWLILMPKQDWKKIMNMKSVI